MAESAWRPAPTCPAAHALEPKVVAGSWFAASKACSKCRTQLSAGLRRSSCKACNYHLCAACAGSRAEEMLNEEVTLTIYRAAQQGLLPGMGVEEDAWQVPIQRGATVGALKATISQLYGLHPGFMALQRDADSQPMPDTELLKYDEGDVVYLRAGLGSAGLAAGLLGGPAGSLPGGGGARGLDGLAAAVSEAAAEAANAVSGALAGMAARREELAATEYSLTVLLLARGTKPERRCRVTVMAVARVAEVLDMVKLELDLETEELALEFAGEKLPLGATVHALGLRDGDTVMASIKESTTSL